MADFIFARKSRNIFGSLLHIILNILLGFISVAITVESGSWVIGILLVFLSKWRVFAIRPRFWWLNIKSNLVDFIVGFSVILTAFFAGSNWLPIHYLLVAFYIIWLVFLKPLSSSTGNLIQALIAVFLGNNIAVIVSSTIDSSISVLICFITGYAACRHILVQDNSTKSPSLLALISGLLSGELAWLLHSWNIVYTFGGSGLIISQLAIIATIVAFILSYIKNSLVRYDGRLKAENIALPIICALLSIAILIISFSEPFFNI